MSRKFEFGRRPKAEDFDDYNPLENQDDFDEYEEEDEDEEVDFDSPSFKRDQIWNDYAEDLDFDE